MYEVHCIDGERFLQAQLEKVHEHVISFRTLDR